MIQLFMSRSGSSVIVPLNLPASHGAMTEAYSQLEQANRTGKTEIVEIKSVIDNLPSYLGGLDPDSRTQLAQLNLLSSIIAKMDSRERSIYAGALDGNSDIPARFRAIPGSPKRPGPTWTSRKSVRSTMPSMVVRTPMLAMCFSSRMPNPSERRRQRSGLTSPPPKRRRVYRFRH